MKNIFYLAIIITSTFFACKKDNYDPPKSRLFGRVVYQNQAIGVRSNGVQLELWQRGYALFTKIPIYIAQDGSYSALLFDGDYKLVRLKGNGPWVDNTDSINVSVRGETQIDVPVIPYFTVSNVSYQKTGSTINATFTVQNVNPNSTLDRVNLYIGTTTIVDNTQQDASAQLAAANVVLGQPTTISVNIPPNIATKDYVFARIGVNTAGVGEAIYSSPQKVSLK